MSDEKKYTVKTPNPHFTGIREGVQFAEGEGQAMKEKAAKLVNTWGYECEELSGDGKSETADEEPDPGQEETAENDAEADEPEKEVKSEKADGKDEESREALRPAKSSNKPVLIDFMDDQGIDRNSDDTKDDLNEKIDAWVAAQADEVPATDDGKETNESGATDSPEANGK